MKKEQSEYPIAILGAFWSYVIYCTNEGTWYLQEIKERHE
jgi:hypothetical protein